MAAKIKLQRIGKKNQPKYRIIVQEERTKLQGKVVAMLGGYNPRQKDQFINLDKENILKWLKIGAVPTDKVRFLFGKAGILPPVDTSVLTKKKPKKAVENKEAAPTEAPKQEEKQAV